MHSILIVRVLLRYSCNQLYFFRKEVTILLVSINNPIARLEENTRNFAAKRISQEEYENYLQFSNGSQPFLIGEKLIYRLVKKSTKTSTEYFILPICTNCEIITSLQDITTNQRMYKIKLYNGETSRIVVFDSNIISTNGCQQLLNFGCIFDDNNIKYLVEYLSLSAINAPIEIVHSKLGWYNNELFLSGNSYSKRNIKSIYVGEINISSHGSLDKYLEMIKEEIIDNTALFFGLLIGFSSMLLGFLNQHIDLGNLLFNYCGNSSKGKTTIAMLATSVFSKPLINNGLMITFNSTSNAIVQFISNANSHTIAIDEVATSEIKHFRKLLYQICSGAERMRLDTNGNMKPVRYFNSAIITTAEFNIIDDSAPDGLRTRIFEIDGNLTTSAENSNKIKKTIIENYGVAGEKYAKYLFSNKTPVLISDYFSTLQELKNVYDEKEYTKFSLTDRILSKLTVILQTAKYFEECFEIVCNYNELIDYVINIERSIGTDSDISEKALEYILQYVSRHRNRFVDSNEESSFAVEGKITKKANYKEIAILKEIVEDVLKCKGFENPKLLYQKWSESKILISEKDRKYKRIRLTKGGEIQPCFVFKIIDL